MNVDATIVAALRSYAEMMQGGEKEAKRGASMPEQRKPTVEREDGTMLIDCTPTPRGFGMMAEVFKQTADDALKLAADIEQRGLFAACRKNGYHAADEEAEDNQDEIDRAVADHERHQGTLDEDDGPLDS